MKHFYGIVFWIEILAVTKSFQLFQVRGNDALTERSLPPNFGACLFLEKGIRVFRFLGILNKTRRFHSED